MGDVRYGNKDVNLVDDLGAAFGTRANPFGVAVASEIQSAGFAWLDGVAGSKINTPSISAHNIAGAIDIRAAIALPDYTVASGMDVLSKWNPTGSQQSFELGVSGAGSAGLLFFQYSTTGANTLGGASTAAVTTTAGFYNGGLYCIRATLTIGGSDSTVKFYTKPTTSKSAYFDTLDDNGWTQLGADVTVASTSNPFASTALLTIGSRDNNSLPLTGRVYASCLKSGLNGTLVHALDFGEGSQWRPNVVSGEGDDGLLYTLQGAAEIRGILPYAEINARADGKRAMEVNDDCTSMECSHATLSGSTDTTVTFAQPVRLVRVVNWDTANNVLVKDGAISSNTDATATRVGVAPAANVPNTRMFPFLTSSIHLRSAGASVVSVEGFY